jgi:hypothetical protein
MTSRFNRIPRARVTISGRKVESFDDLNRSIPLKKHEIHNGEVLLLPGDNEAMIIDSINWSID